MGRERIVKETHTKSVQERLYWLVETEGQGVDSKKSLASGSRSYGVSRVEFIDSFYLSCCVAEELGYQLWSQTAPGGQIPVVLKQLCGLGQMT